MNCVKQLALKALQTPARRISAAWEKARVFAWRPMPGGRVFVPRAAAEDMTLRLRALKRLGVITWWEMELDERDHIHFYLEIKYTYQGGAGMECWRVW